MDRKDSQENQPSSSARNERRQILKGKSRVSYRRTPPQYLFPNRTSGQITPLSETGSKVPIMTSQGHLMHHSNISTISVMNASEHASPITQCAQRTPLNDITTSTINQRIHTIGPSTSTTFPISTLTCCHDTATIQSKRKRKRVDTNAFGINLMNRFGYVNSNEPSETQGASTSQMNIQHIPSLNSNAIHDDSTSDEDNFQGFDAQGGNSSDDEFVPDEYVPPQSTYLIQEYYDIGDQHFECQWCGAQMWYQERIDKSRHAANPNFALCCSKGKIQLPLLNMPPDYLCHLLFNNVSKDSKNYQEHIRAYNLMFAFTSPGAKLDNTFNNGRGPPTLRIQGQTCHRIGSLLPTPGSTPKFAQLYIYDTDNELKHRTANFSKNSKIDVHIVEQLKVMLDQHNSHAKSFRMARGRMQGLNVPNLKLRLISERSTDGRIYNLPSVSEVAALIVGDVDTAEVRDIIMERCSGNLKRIDELHTSYLGYQYPLLFPYGEDGYRKDVLHRDMGPYMQNRRNRLTIREYLTFRIMSRQIEPPTILRSRRLFQQFLVDGYSMLEADRLKFIRMNQPKLRVDKYSNLNKPTNQPNTKGSTQGKRIVLPSTFVGGKRYMDQLYYDGMAICGAVGFPDLFITFTCNPNWPEIQRVLKPFNLSPNDRPDLIARVFKIKLDELIADLTKSHVFGRVLAYMYTIEFQKRGLPHAHIIIFLHPTSKYPEPADIDTIISAEIPSQAHHFELHKLVKTHMLHGPCGQANPSTTCTKLGKCTKFFPKPFQEQTMVDRDGFPVYKRRQNGRTIEKPNFTFDNRHVVPYNPFLLLKYQAHINVEWCNQGSSIKYLFKYINKGYDRITAAIVSPEPDEIKQYLDCRYVSPSEACWRIFSFPIHGRKPAVERMFFHLPGEHGVIYNDYDIIDQVIANPTVSESMFTAWFQANNTYAEARNLTYVQLVSKFVYVKSKRFWKPRTKGYTIGRLIWVPPSTGELYFLRMLLNCCKGPLNFEDIRKVGDHVHETFRAACFALGLLEDDAEFINALKEASHWGSGYFLRKLFVIMLLSNTMNRPDHVWGKSWSFLSDGILYEKRRLLQNKDLQINEEDLKNLTLIEIETLLQKNKKSLRDFVPMPFPTNYTSPQLGNRLIHEELNFDIPLLREEFNRLFSSLTDEQRQIYDAIMDAVKNDRGGVYFLNGFGGAGKTFMWSTFSASLRSEGHIVLNVASSGIASLLLPGGKTAHSKFKIPVPTLANSTCNIDQGSELAGLLKATKMIIWDEAPMTHKHCFEALDRTMRDIVGGGYNKHKLFGGKIVIFGGDFRQILPVVPGGSRSDIVHATINASYIWDQCQMFHLTKNMRLQTGNNDVDQAELKQFSKWILDVGDGKINLPNDGYAEIDIPNDLLITNFENPIEAIVQSTYPDLLHHYQNQHFLQSRAILASTIETVDLINDYVLQLIPGEERGYLSADSLDKTDVSHTAAFDVLTTELLNTLRTSGLPNHKIKLKVGCPIMLLRNIDQAEGLCNGTRLIVTKLGKHVLQAKIISGKNIGNIIYIPRMSMSPSQSPWPFKLNRRQFPIIVSFAMTINKSQGQSLESVGLYLPKDVFSHGQLYVAISRVKSRKGLKILIHDKEKKPLQTTTNVVFKEVFHNL